MSFREISIFLILLFVGCSKKESKIIPEQKPNNNADSIALEKELLKEDTIIKYRFATDIDSNLLLLDDKGIPLIYDDEITYLDFPNFPQMVFASEFHISVRHYYENVLKKKIYNTEDSNNYTYTQEFVDFFNSKVNFVYELPMKTKDEKLDEVFNKLYYDYKDCDILEDDKGFGYQKYVMIQNDKIKTKLTIRRNKNTKNLQIAY